MTGFVYLIESECGRLKIGCSSDPLVRLRAFTTNAPRPVRLLAQWPGDKSDEADLHQRFAPYRRHNEWFAIEGDVADFIREKRGIGVPGDIPSWASISFETFRDRAKAGRVKASETLKEGFRSGRLTSWRTPS